MTTTARQERSSRTELGRILMAAGILTPDWAPAFAAVDRADFLPDLVWAWDMDTGQAVPVERTQDPDRWYAAVDQDQPIVTQWDDGQHTGPEPGRVPTSSSSMPSVVFGLLTDLDPQPGGTVLDVGTGSGETAGLLAHRLGDAAVTTVDIDADASRAAGERLRRLGLRPDLVVGDGVGAAPCGPYDRVLVTCGLRDFGSITQAVKPGGLLVAPWGTHFTHADAVVCLEAEGGGASGRFTRPVEFMKARDQRGPAVVHADYVRSVGEGDRGTTTVSEAEFPTGRFEPGVFAMGLRVRDARMMVAAKTGGARPVWIYGLTDRSWACVMFSDHAGTRVWQSGPRRLWDEVEAAVRWWIEQGRPRHDRFGLTVTPEETRAWLDKPEQSWQL